ncbi:MULTISPECIES: glutaredoxin family protein [unclassified Luteococcus]|uniref:glutaredoxin family protein n=1 Tax=unclassified Luteococcus TaxID=2639923 RepID=UPI00313AEDCB
MPAPAAGTTDSVDMRGCDVLLVTRTGCHLCELAEPVVRRVSQEHGTSVAVVDVDSDEQLRARFTDHVPVIHVRGRLLDYWQVDEGRLRRALAGEDVPAPPPL